METKKFGESTENKAGSVNTEDDTIIIKRKKRRFFKKVRGFRRFLLFFGIWFFVAIVFLAASAEYTSRPGFCPTCHYMEPFYQSWKTSSHNKINCVECHFEPGLSGKIKGKMNGLVQIVSYVSRSYKKRKPWADIPDNTCSKSGCHDRQASNDTTYDFGGISFSHKNHLTGQKRGKTLKCTSCHSQIVQGSHIQVTTTTCFNCHFKKSDDPEHKYDKLTECTKCHDWKHKTEEQLASLRYNHNIVVKNDIQCNSCHNKVISGNGDVGKERCYQCHFENERIDKYDDTEFIHSTHIVKHSVSCLMCHSPIKHKIEKIDPNAPPDCVSCHTNAHSSQVNLYSGENGFNVEKMPSSMYLSGINCKGCHTFHELDKRNITTDKAEKKSCDKCHGEGYGNLVKQWETSSVKRLGTIKSIYNTAKIIVNATKSDKKTEALQKLNEAEHNIKIVEIGKSVHNVQFADKLLIGSYGLMNQALTLIGSAKKLPEFKSSSEYIPNECYNCHSGIQDITVKKFNMNFSHNRHIAKEKIECTKCHSNANKHGELIITKENCNNCHHSQAKTNDVCNKCHPFQVQVFNGNFMNKNTPDMMKAGGVGCVDCHLSNDKVLKPDSKICAKCHDADYEKMTGEWKNDIKNLTGAINSEISKMNTANLSDDQKNEVAEAKKLLVKINSAPSIYVHNYGLVSDLLSEKKSKMSKLNK
ncbi:MAG: NapC/NirT family cytochrome c [Ignavibacteriae bacterium]|nr:NapC/NirT family cytochrome c [Ignavibacteriota bacterium]